MITVRVFVYIYEVIRYDWVFLIIWIYHRIIHNHKKLLQRTYTARIYFNSKLANAKSYPPNS